MKPIASLVDVKRDKKRPRTFSLIFKDQTLVYETETLVEVMEIVQRLTFLQQLEKRQQQRLSLGKRTSVDIKKQAVSLSYGNSAKRASTIARFFHKRSRSEDKGMLNKRLMKYNKPKSPDNRRNSFWASAYIPISENEELKGHPQHKRTSTSALLFKSMRTRCFRSQSLTLPIGEENDIDELYEEAIQNSKGLLSPDGIYNKPVKQWTVQDVGVWLEQVGFGALKNRFADEEVDGEVLLTLTLAELKDDFGMELLEERKKLFHRISDLKSQHSRGGMIGL